MMTRSNVHCPFLGVITSHGMHEERRRGRGERGREDREREREGREERKGEGSSDFL